MFRGFLPNLGTHHRGDDTNPSESVSGVSVQKGPSPLHDHCYLKSALNHT